MAERTATSGKEFRRRFLHRAEANRSGNREFEGCWAGANAGPIGSISATAIAIGCSQIAMSADSLKRLSRPTKTSIYKKRKAADVTQRMVVGATGIEPVTPPV